MCARHCARWLASVEEKVPHFKKRKCPIGALLTTVRQILFITDGGDTFGFRSVDNKLENLFGARHFHFIFRARGFSGMSDKPASCRGHDGVFTGGAFRV
jgi:hypothetical protein